MKTFLSSTLAPWLALLAVYAAQSWPALNHGPGRWITLIAMLLGLPLGAGWAAAEAARWWRGDRAFGRTLKGRIVRGLAAGLLSMTLVLLAWALFAWEWPDGVVIVPACVLANAVVLAWPARRARAGCCSSCGYSLAGLPESRCPECGKDFAAEAVVAQ